MPRPQKTPIDYENLAKRKGFVWIGPYVKRVKEKTTWKCNNGHFWETTFDTLSGKRGRGCPRCGEERGANARRKKPEDYHDIAQLKGARWLGPEVTSIRKKTSWMCHKGHVYRTTYSTVYKGEGNGCIFCANEATGDSKRHSSYMYKMLASRKGIYWLGPEVSDSTLDTLWMCAKGHRWKTCYRNLYTGAGCPECGKVLNVVNSYRTLTAIDYHLLARKREFFWVGPFPNNGNTSTEWACEKGHLWKAPFFNIHAGRGCPLCIDMENGHRTSSQQRELNGMLGGELNYRIGKQSIDIALNISGIKIAIEYDGWYWHKDKIVHDIKKSENLIKRGWKVLRIKSRHAIPTLDDIKFRIEHLLTESSYQEIVMEDW